VQAHPIQRHHVGSHLCNETRLCTSTVGLSCRHWFKPYTTNSLAHIDVNLRSKSFDPDAITNPTIDTHLDADLAAQAHPIQCG
jgi:hypothetical protein